jgi:hypothetical protein
MKTERFLKYLVLEIIAVGLIAGYFLIDSSDIYRWYVGNTNFVKQSKTCDLHKEACSVTLKDGSVVTLSISPRPIPLMKPITLHVETKNIGLEKLDLKVFATNMNMGLIEKPIKRVKKDNYKAVITLPTCIVGGMIWNVNIIANKPSKSVGAVFEFQTTK